LEFGQEECGEVGELTSAMNTGEDGLVQPDDARWFKAVLRRRFLHTAIENGCEGRAEKVGKNGSVPGALLVRPRRGRNVGRVVAGGACGRSCTAKGKEAVARGRGRP